MQASIDSVDSLRSLLDLANDSSLARREREITTHRQIAPALSQKGVLVVFEDEIWVLLYPKVEVEWVPSREQKKGTALYIVFIIQAFFPLEFFFGLAFFFATFSPPAPLVGELKH